MDNVFARQSVGWGDDGRHHLQLSSLVVEIIQVILQQLPSGLLQSGAYVTNQLQFGIRRVHYGVRGDLGYVAQTDLDVLTVEAFLRKHYG